MYEIGHIPTSMLIYKKKLWEQHLDCKNKKGQGRSLLAGESFQEVFGLALGELINPPLSSQQPWGYYEFICVLKSALVRIFKPRVWKIYKLGFALEYKEKLLIKIRLVF